MHVPHFILGLSYMIVALFIAFVTVQLIRSTPEGVQAMEAFSSLVMLVLAGWLFRNGIRAIVKR